MKTQQQIKEAYQSIRKKTEALCEPLAIEDYVIQAIDDVSPPKWHLAHTTWFFETFILQHQYPAYANFNPIFQHLFNSYYQRLGDPFPRIKRGLLSRPTVKTVYEYRHYVDKHMLELLEKNPSADLLALVTLGLHHEEQHQELLMMDIKYNFSIHPESPLYQTKKSSHPQSTIPSIEYVAMEGGVVEIGHESEHFCFDNEKPRHQVLLKPYALANRLITNAEYLEFMLAGGYQSHEWWLSDGWDCVLKNAWDSPLYWRQQQNDWYLFTLNGLQPLNPNEPVVHVSYYEADAFARWKGLRLPSEAEWEHFVNQNNILSSQGNFLENHLHHPQAFDASHTQLFGDVWEWTSSPYMPYHEYQPLAGALGEYNGKFMSNQMVLRGGCCVTPKAHIRSSYRNFFQPDKRWQFSGIRLAHSL